MSDDFRAQIQYLEGQAAQQRPTFEEPPKKRPSRLKAIVGVGLVLVVLELLFLVFQSREHEQTRRTSDVRNPLSRLTDCRGVAYHTYTKIVAYLGEHGTPPASLGDLLGTHLDELPLDPVSKQPLIYETDGKGFDLRCPKPPSR